MTRKICQLTQVEERDVTEKEIEKMVEKKEIRMEGKSIRIDKPTDGVKPTDIRNYRRDLYREK